MGKKDNEEKTSTSEALAKVDERERELSISGKSGLTVSKGAAARALAGNKGYHLEQVLPLREGDAVEGMFTGQGADIELAEEVFNETTGELTHKKMKSWKVAVNPQVTVVLPGSYKLNQFFGGLAVGTMVVVEHLGQDRVGKNVVNRYACAALRPEPPLGMKPQ